MNIQKLKDKISLITNETEQGANTAERVGNTMNDIVDTLSVPVINISKLVNEFYESGEEELTTECSAEELKEIIGINPSDLKKYNFITLQYTTNSDVENGIPTYTICKQAPIINAIIDNVSMFGIYYYFEDEMLVYEGYPGITISIQVMSNGLISQYMVGIMKGEPFSTNYAHRTIDSSFSFPLYPMNPVIYTIPNCTPLEPIILNVLDYNLEIPYEISDNVIIIGNFTIDENNLEQKIYLTEDKDSIEGFEPIATITEQGNYQFVFANGRLTINKTYN